MNGSVARVGKEKNILKERYNFECLGVRWEYDIKIELGSGDVAWIHLTRDRNKWRTVVNKEFHKMLRIY
jgi:hypothetical protein